MRRLTRGTIREARNILTLTRARASGGGAGGVAMPQPTAQNQMIISNATPAWSLLAAPTAQYQVPIAGADPYTPAWAALTIGAISDLAYAVPALTLSTSNIEGSADTVIRSDATVLVFDTTAPNTIEPDDAAAAGSASIAARRDHEHGIVCAAPVATGTANAEGSATSFPRSDHVHLLHVHDHSGNAGDGGQLDWDLIWSDAVHDHTSDAEGGVLDLSAISDLDYAVPALTLSTGNAEGAADTVIRSDATILIFDATVPDVIQPDDAAAAGSAAVAARRDHTHGIVCAAPASPSVSVDASAEGSGTSFARADHMHQLDQAIVPTWTGLHTFNIGIKFGGVLAANTITAPDNAILAVRLIDAGNIEYLRVVSTDTQPAVVFNDGGADVDHRWEAVGQANALFVRGSDGKIGIWASTLNARVEIGGTPGPAMLNLPTNLSTIDAGLSSRNIASESIIVFGNNVHSSYTGRTVTAEAGAAVRLDTRDQDGGTINKYTIFHVLTRAAGAAEASYTVPFQIAAGAPTGSLVIHRTGQVQATSDAAITGYFITTKANGNTNALQGTAITNNTGDNRAFYAHVANAGAGEAYTFYGTGARLYNDDDITIARTAGSFLFLSAAGGDERAGMHSNVSNELLFKVGAAALAMTIDLNSKVIIADLGGGGSQDVGADNTGKLYVPFVSDRRFKNDIKPLSGGLDVIKALRGVTYNWKADELAKVGLDFGECGRQVGLIAQEVVEVIPQARSDGKQYKSYDKSMIAPYLIEAIKELDARLIKGGL